jgi:hypothetical protein
VVPAKVTLEPVLSLERSIELEAGAAMSDKTMSVHDATAEEIDANAVMVQGVAAFAPNAKGITAKMRFFMMDCF